MTDEPSHPHTALSDSHRVRIDFARRELEAARAADLAQMAPAGLIFQIERLRARLDDIPPRNGAGPAPPPAPRPRPLSVAGHRHQGSA
jgi:hypothetical protein